MPSGYHLATSAGESVSVCLPMASPTAMPLRHPRMRLATVNLAQGQGVAAKPLISQLPLHRRSCTVRLGLPGALCNVGVTTEGPRYDREAGRRDRCRGVWLRAHLLPDGRRSGASETGVQDPRTPCRPSLGTSLLFSFRTAPPAIDLRGIAPFSLLTYQDARDLRPRHSRGDTRLGDAPWEAGARLRRVRGRAPLAHDGSDCDARALGRGWPGRG